MAAAYFTPEIIVSYLYHRTEVLGVNAFPHNGRAHYYSGPNATVRNELEKAYGSLFPDNRERALSWAAKHSATIIDNTPLGHYLNNFDGQNLFAYYGYDFDKAIKPWKELSRLFALSMWGHVSTTVCGANPDAVYGSIEIPNTINPHHSDTVPPNSFDAAFYAALLDRKTFYDFRAILNPDGREVTHINIRPFNEFETLYNPSDVIPVHRRVCLSEQRMGLHEAIEGADIKTIKTALRVASQEVCTRPVEAYEYFLDSRERFLLDRKNMMKNAAHTTAPFYKRSPTERAQHKGAELKQFGLMVWSLIETELALMPASKRPNIILPPCLAGAVPTP